MRIVRIDAEHGPAMGRLEPDGRVRPFAFTDSTPLIEAAVADGAPDSLPLGDAMSDGRWLSPVSDPSKIVGIGLNYVDHATEATMTPPSEPLVFAKFPSSIIGPGATIRWSRSVSTSVDYEAELAVVIGARAREVPLERALDHVFGYSCLNDVSARDLQFGDKQWVRGKSLDSFCPIGPVIVTADEIADPQNLSIACRIGSEVLQDASTADMIFGVAELVSRLSHWFTLEPGDVIATGTPPGVGWFRDPRRLLGPGDEVTVDVGGIGSLTNPVVVDE